MVFGVTGAGGGIVALILAISFSSSELAEFRASCIFWAAMLAEVATLLADASRLAVVNRVPAERWLELVF